MCMKKFFGVCVIQVLLTGMLYSQAVITGKVSLRQCVETAIANNLGVRQSSLQSETSEINWKQAKQNMLPNLNAFANHGINRGRSIDPFTNSFINQQINFAGYGLSSGVVLFNGLSMQHTAQQTKLAYDASVMDLQQQKDNITLNIILAYLLVLSNEDVLVQLANQAELTQKQVERLELMNKEGAIAPFLLSDLQGQYTNDKLNIITAKNALESAKLNLCQLMNIPYSKDLSPERLETGSVLQRYEEEPGNIYQTALQQFALVKAADLRLRSAGKGVKAAKGALYPVLSFGVNLNTNYSSAAAQSFYINTTEVVSNDFVLVNGNPSPVIKQRDNFNTEKITYNRQLNNNLFGSAGLNLRIPIFNANQNRNRIKLAQIEEKNTTVVLQTVKTQLQQAIEQAHLDMQTASERYKTLLEQQAAFAESFRAAEIRFNEGVGNSIDYLTAKNNLDRARINLINAQYDYLLRTKVLDYYKGVVIW